MPFTVQLDQPARSELERLRSYGQRRITDAMRAHLTDTPHVETRNRKRFRREQRADFRYTPPLWELRVGDFRVLYDVDVSEETVFVHAVRHKPPGTTTEEVLNEANRH